MNSHIAFLNFPHAPHINPTLSIVSTLVRRGYRVTYVTSSRFAATVRETGAEVVLCPEFPNFPALMNQLHGKEEDYSPVFDLAVSSLPKVTQFYERSIPALVLYDFMFYAGRILAHKLRVPAIQTSPALAFDREKVSRELKPSEFRKSVLDYKTKIDAFLESYGIARTSFVHHREKLNIFLYPSAFQIGGDAFDETCFYAGRCAGERPYRKTWQRKNDSERPLVLVSTSTFYVQGSAYFRMCVEALSCLELDVVLAIGDNNDPASLVPLPDHVEVVQGVPQIQILPHAAVLVCLGGMTTTVEAMYHGVALLMITHGYAEPEAYAENMVRLGLGIHLRKDQTSVESIRRSVVALLSGTEISGRVREMKRVVRREAGAEETANRIEEYGGLS